MFYNVDEDGSGRIEKEEFVLLHGTGPTTFSTLEGAVDDGKVSMDEWLGFLHELEGRDGENALKFLLRRLEATPHHHTVYMQHTYLPYMVISNSSCCGASRLFPPPTLALLATA